MQLVTLWESPPQQTKSVSYVSTRQLVSIYRTTLDKLFNKLPFTWEHLLGLNGLSFRPQTDCDIELFIPYDKVLMTALAPLVIDTREVESIQMMSMTDSDLYMINHRILKHRGPVANYHPSFSLMAYQYGTTSRVLKGFLIATLNQQHQICIHVLEAKDAPGEEENVLLILFHRLQQAILENNDPRIQQIILHTDSSHFDAIEFYQQNGFSITSIDSQAKKYVMRLELTSIDAKSTLINRLMQVEIQRRYLALLSENVQREVTQRLHYTLHSLPRIEKQKTENVLQAAEADFNAIEHNPVYEDTATLASIFSKKLVALLVDEFYPEYYIVSLMPYIYPRPQIPSEGKDSISQLIARSFFSRRPPIPEDQADEGTSLTQLSYGILLNRIIKLSTQLKYLMRIQQKTQATMNITYDACIQQFQGYDRWFIERACRRAEEQMENLIKGVPEGAVREFSSFLQSCSVDQLPIEHDPAQWIQRFSEKLYQYIHAAFPGESSMAVSCQLNESAAQHNT